MSVLSYLELYKRNQPIIPLEIQRSVGNLKVAVAGCGSTGGAFIDGLLRLGVQNFHLTDNGDYELNNLNRQMVFLSDLNKNKSVAHKERIVNTNTQAQVQTWDSGLTLENMNAFLEGVDFLFDAVDVTTMSGMRMKLELHKRAFEQKIPTGSALDLGYTQWLQSYNYHRGESLLKGKYSSALMCQNPLKALIEGFSDVEELPYEIAEELLRLLKNPKESACQLACVCFVLAGMVTPYMLYFLEKGELPPLTSIDLMSFFEDQATKEKRILKTQEIHRALRDELSRIV